MRTTSIILIILSALMMSNCETPRYVEAGVIWMDDSYFNADGDWYLAISEGLYSSEEGAIVEVVEQIAIRANVDAIQRFVLGSGPEGNLTAFVYVDVNGNGLYDDEYDNITGYKYNYAVNNETTQIAVMAYF